MASKGSGFVIPMRITSKEIIAKVNDESFNDTINSFVEMDSNEDIPKKYIDNLVEGYFKAYANCEKKKSLSAYENAPKNLIRLYYSLDRKMDFSSVMSKFKRKYILQESRFEQVESKAEREGLGLVYDYISSDEWKKMSFISLLIQKLHSVLYSKTPHPEAGGSFRVIPVYLPNSGIETTEPFLIFREVAQLNDALNELKEQGSELGKGIYDGDSIIRYIDNCIKLKCELIRIHPFFDGNGRTMRALVNILFKEAGLPPVYVKVPRNKLNNEEYCNKLLGMLKNVCEKTSLEADFPSFGETNFQGKLIKIIEKVYNNTSYDKIASNPFYNDLEFCDDVKHIRELYEKISQRKKYENAMNKAIINKDYKDINNFYYQRICDSIYELDIKDRRINRIKETNINSIDASENIVRLLKRNNM